MGLDINYSDLESTPVLILPLLKASGTISPIVN